MNTESKGLAGVDARAVRDELLVSLKDATGADLASFNKLVAADGGGLTPVDFQVPDDEAFLVALLRIAGVRLRALDVDLSDMSTLDAFSAASYEDMPAAIRQQVWAPLDVHSCLSANVTHHGVMLGHIALLRRGTSRRFTTEDATAADELVPAIQAALVEASRLEPEVSIAEATLLFEPSGSVVYASDRALLEQPLPDRLPLLVQDFVAGRGPAVGMVGSARVVLKRLAGGGSEVILAHLRTTSLGTVTEALSLSPLKRRIVAYANQGATVAEIARALERSPETVRAHLKQIYRRLGVGSRVELAAACRDEV